MPPAIRSVLSGTAFNLSPRLPLEMRHTGLSGSHDTELSQSANDSCPTRQPFIRVTTAPRELWGCTAIEIASSHGRDLPDLGRLGGTASRIGDGRHAPIPSPSSLPGPLILSGS